MRSGILAVLVVMTLVGTNVVGAVGRAEKGHAEHGRSTMQVASDGYVGADACVDCHRPQHQAWSRTKHATALTRLSAEDRASGRCIRCHVTGTAERIAADGAEPTWPNVQCEACHGPGRAHVDAARAGAAATVKTAPVVEDTCTRCHNETSPYYKRFFFSALKGLVHRVSQESADRPARR